MSQDSRSEKEIRDDLAKRLGIEFCTEEELAEESEKAAAEPVVEQQPTGISVSDIIRMCNESAAKMGLKNPNKHLLYVCAAALKQMSDRLYKYEMKVN